MWLNAKNSHCMAVLDLIAMDDFVRVMINEASVLYTTKHMPVPAYANQYAAM